MEQVNLTGTGLTVSRICLGTMTFGDQLNEEDSINLLKRAVEKGINFIDTADIYVHGVSETITGKALQGMRDEIVLASKVGGPSEKGLNGKGLNRKHMIRSVENSLQRLGGISGSLFAFLIPQLDEAWHEPSMIQGASRYFG
jgi:aryl-alcohol dehydrogenase-like predicted oxidoreductase